MAAIAAAAGVLRCTSMTPEQQGTVTGAAIGTAAGWIKQGGGWQGGTRS